MGAPCIAATQPPCHLTSEKGIQIVTDFVLLKAFDIVSSGAYRKHLLLSKDRLENWAIIQHQSYHVLVHKPSLPNIFFNTLLNNKTPMNRFIPFHR